MSAKWGAPAMLVATALAFAGPLGQWLAAAVVLLVLPDTVRVLAAHRTSAPAVAWLRVHAPTILVASTLVLLFHELALGHPPASRDHGVHLFQTRILVQELLPQGSFRGWSQSYNAGYPFGDSYPVLGYVLTGAASFLSGGVIPLRVSYAWGILAVWLLSTIAVAALARALAREIVDDPRSPAVAWAGGIAAVAWLLDPGAGRQGGWNYLMFHGVWPQQLSTALWVGGNVLFWRAIQAPSPRRLALAGIAFGGSLLAHPFGLLTLAGSAIAWIPALAWASREERIQAGTWRWWVVVHGGAASLAVGWLMGFFASADAMGRSPVPFQTLGSLAGDLVAGELFTNSRAWGSVAAVVGLGLAVRRGAVLAAVVVISFLGLMLAASHEAITVLGLDLLVSGFKNLQFPRYTIALKPLWFAMAGVGAAWLGAAWLASRRPESTRNFGLWRWVAPVIFAPALVVTCAAPTHVVPRPVGAVSMLEGTTHGATEALLRGQLEAETTRLGRPLRVAFLRTGRSGATYALFAITDVGADLVLDSHVPAMNYRHWLRTTDVRSLATLGVTHVVHDGSVGDEALRAALARVGAAGPWTLSRFEPPGGVMTNPSARTVGDGSASETVGAPGIATSNGWRFDVPVSDRPRRIALSVGPYRKWRASDRRGALPLVAAQVAPGLPGLIVTASGPFALDYLPSPRERRAVGVSWLALALALAFCFAGRPLPPLPRRTLRGPAAVVLLVLAALALLMLTRARRDGLRETWASVSPPGQTSEPRLVRDLVLNEGWALSSRRFPACDGLLGRDARAGCSPADERAHRSFLYRDPFLYRCVEFVVDPGMRRDLVWLGLEPGQQWVGLLSVPREPLDLEIGQLAQRITKGRSHTLHAIADEDGRVVMRFFNPGDGVRRVCAAAALRD